VERKEIDENKHVCQNRAHDAKSENIKDLVVGGVLSGGVLRSDDRRLHRQLRTPGVKFLSRIELGHFPSPYFPPLLKETAFGCRLFRPAPMCSESVMDVQHISVNSVNGIG
jgi:hypothetical protein